jgi:hypothetical protein
LHPNLWQNTTFCHFWGHNLDENLFLMTSWCICPLSSASYIPDIISRG